MRLNLVLHWCHVPSRAEWDGGERGGVRGGGLDFRWDSSCSLCCSMTFLESRRGFLTELVWFGLKGEKIGNICEERSFINENYTKILQNFTGYSAVHTKIIGDLDRIRMLHYYVWCLMSGRQLRAPAPRGVSCSWDRAPPSNLVRDLPNAAGK